MAKEKETNGAMLTSEELSVFCDQIALILESGMTMKDGVDMLAEGYPVVCRKEIAPDECAILFDLDTIEEEDFRVIGTCARVGQPEETAEGLRFTLRTADGIRSFTRLRLPREPKQVAGAQWSWDDASRSVLIWYDSDGAEIEIEIVYD